MNFNYQTRRQRCIRTPEFFSGQLIFLKHDMSSYVYLVCIFFMFPTLDAAVVAGGLNEIPVDSPEVIRLSNYILMSLNEGNNGSTKSLVEVLNASVQVVAGTLTRLTLRITEDSEEKICDVSIWERPWLNQTEITDVHCEDAVSRSKREITLEKDSYNYDIGAFNSFLKKHNKSYNNEAEYKRRYHIFKANLKKIKLLRDMELGTGKYGATWFADLSSNEFKQYLGLKIPEFVDKLSRAEIPHISLPDEFDWRHFNIVTPVKNQGPCGSCWAFSVTGNIEGQWALKKKQLISLSEQELIDCDTEDSGCSGGFMTNAYKSIVKIGGLETELDYPYEAENEKCQFNKTKVKVKITGGVNITSDEDGMAKWLVKNGPMSVALNANAMQFYMGGISHPMKFLCNPDDLNHGVLIVGFGVKHSRFYNKAIPYWIVKNSWGKHWGELGYYKIFRGKGVCGINKEVSSAIVDNL